MIHLQLPAVVCYYCCCCCCCCCCLLWLCLRRASGGDPYTRGTRSAAASSLLCMCCFVHVEDTRPQQTATFRTAVPFWGQNTWNYSSLSPKRDCSPIRVNTSKEGCAGTIYSDRWQEEEYYYYNSCLLTYQQRINTSWCSRPDSSIYAVYAAPECLRSRSTSPSSQILLTDSYKLCHRYRSLIITPIYPDCLDRRSGKFGVDLDLFWGT